jgi:hypothetical protein
MWMESLRNRIRAMNSLWDRLVSDMTLEQVNHHERQGVLPIAFSLNHYMLGQNVSGLTLTSTVALRRWRRWRDYASVTSKPGKPISPK